MRILVINPNTSVEMSDVMRDQLRAVGKTITRDLLDPPGHR
jgi:Asp/Glu/hydantoin racemase